MPATLVPTVRTSYTQAQLIEGFVRGWFKTFGVLPSKKSIGVLYAQNTLETGSSIAMWNNNIGNVKFVPNANPAKDDGVTYMMLANVWEIVNGKKVIFQPPSPATWFRAFETLADGIAFQLGFLRNYRYKKAWTAVEAGDPAEFAHLLRVAGYYTAPEADYVKLMNYHFNVFMKTNSFELAVAKLQAPVPEPIPEPPVPEPVVVPPTPVEVPPPVEVVPPPVTNKDPLPTKGVWGSLIDIFFPLLRLFKK